MTENAIKVCTLAFGVSVTTRLHQNYRWGWYILDINEFDDGTSCFVAYSIGWECSAVLPEQIRNGSQKLNNPHILLNCFQRTKIRNSFGCAFPNSKNFCVVFLVPNFLPHDWHLTAELDKNLCLAEKFKNAQNISNSNKITGKTLFTCYC